MKKAALSSVMLLILASNCEKRMFGRLLLQNCKPCASLKVHFIFYFFVFVFFDICLLNTLSQVYTGFGFHFLWMTRALFTSFYILGGLYMELFKFRLSFQFSKALLQTTYPDWKFITIAIWLRVLGETEILNQLNEKTQLVFPCLNLT